MTGVHSTFLDFDDWTDLRSELDARAFAAISPRVRLDGRPVQLSPYETWCCSRASERAGGRRVPAISFVGSSKAAHAICFECGARSGLLVYRIGRVERLAYVPCEWPSLWAAEEIAAECTARGYDLDAVTMARAQVGGCHGWHCCLQSLRGLLGR